MRRKSDRDEKPTARPEPVSLAPLSFEDALKALVATPPMTEKPKRQPTRTKTKRKKKTT